MKIKLAVLAVAVSLAQGVVAITVAPNASAQTISTRTLLNQLVVGAEHPAGYNRSLFPTWVDADHDGCDTREEVLIAEATHVAVDASCSIISGQWFSKYDGVTTTDPSTFDIDHLVPLAEAWQSGAWRWNTDTRTRYANDLGYGPDLIAVTAHSNRSKGEQEPQDWLPDRVAFRCTYMAWWVAVKWRWQLKVNPAEKTFLHDRLAACGWPSVAKPSRPRTSSSGGSVGTGSSAGGARITAIYFDSPGADTESNASLNAEWVRIRNVTNSRKTLTGWTLRDTSSHIYRFPAFHLAAGATVKVHTGSGSDTAGNLYWHASGYIWNNTGDTAVLKNANGSTVDRCSYTSAADPQASC